MEKINFKDAPSTETPLSAFTLNKMQENIEKAINESVVTKIGGANYLLNSQQSVQISVPDSNYNQYWWTNTHPMCSKTSNKEFEYTLSFRFVPTVEGNVPATSIVVGGVTSGDGWALRIYFGDNWKVEKREGYYIYSISFVIAGNNDEYMSRIGFLAECVSSNVGGIVSHIKLEEGSVRSDWTPCIAENVYLSEEHLIGTWIDGKPLYRKVINCGKPQDYTDTNIETGLTDVNVHKIDALLKDYGTSSTTYESVLQIPYCVDTKNVHITVNNYGRNILVRTNDEWQAFGYNLWVILEYTKTTD